MAAHLKDADVQPAELNSIPGDFEKRTFEIDSIEIRAGDGENSGVISGHAAVFDKLSVDLGGFRETIDRGAFAASIKRDDIRALINHDPNMILARNKSGTLRLNEDATGLYYEVDTPETTYARDLSVSIGRGDVSQCSFAFQIDGKKGERWEVDGKDSDMAGVFDALWDKGKHEVVRHVVKARLFDVSPVTYPAYPQTDVSVRVVPQDAAEARQLIERLQGYISNAEAPEDQGREEVTRDVEDLEMKRRKIIALSQ